MYDSCREKSAGERRNDEPDGELSSDFGEGKGGKSSSSLIVHYCALIVHYCALELTRGMVKMDVREFANGDKFVNLVLDAKNVIGGN